MTYVKWAYFAIFWYFINEMINQKNNQENNWHINNENNGCSPKMNIAHTVYYLIEYFVSIF